MDFSSYWQRPNEEQKCALSRRPVTVSLRILALETQPYDTVRIKQRRIMTERGRTKLHVQRPGPIEFASYPADARFQTKRLTRLRGKRNFPTQYTYSCNFLTRFTILPYPRASVCIARWDTLDSSRE